MEKISTYEGESNMRVRELHRGRILIFELPLNNIRKRVAEYAACMVEMRRGGRMSDGIPERTDLVVGLGTGGRKILKWI